MTETINYQATWDIRLTDSMIAFGANNRLSFSRFCPTREQGFEERFGGFFCDGGDFGFGEAGFFQETVECAFFETEPHVGVKLAGLLEGVFV